MMKKEMLIAMFAVGCIVNSALASEKTKIDTANSYIDIKKPCANIKKSRQYITGENITTNIDNLSRKHDNIPHLLSRAKAGDLEADRQGVVMFVVYNQKSNNYYSTVSSEYTSERWEELILDEQAVRCPNMLLRFHDKKTRRGTVYLAGTRSGSECWRFKDSFEKLSSADQKQFCFF